MLTWSNSRNSDSSITIYNRNIRIGHTINSNIDSTNSVFRKVDCDSFIITISNVFNSHIHIRSDSADSEWVATLTANMVIVTIIDCNSLIFTSLKARNCEDCTSSIIYLFSVIFSAIYFNSHITCYV